LQQALHQALQAYLQVLDRYTLADLLGSSQRAQLLPLLQLDAVLPGPAF
jgi:DNA-binding IscR family transcriptional regulator